MPEPDRISDTLGDLVRVHGWQVIGIEHGPHADRTGMGSQEFAELAREHRPVVGVIDADHAVAGSEGLVGQIHVQGDSGPSRAEPLLGQQLGESGQVEPEPGSILSSALGAWRGLVGTVTLWFG